jgi:hypothetical protein
MPAWRSERSTILRITEESSTMSARVLSMGFTTLRFTRAGHEIACAIF